MPSWSFAKLRRSVPAGDPCRLRISVSGEGNPSGEFVLYWAQSARRMRANAALDYATERANELGLPVVVFESLRPDYPGASDRLHTFILQGVAQNAADAADRGLHYYFFLPRHSDEARGVLTRLAARARLVVTDEFPTFIVRDQTRRFVARAPVAVHLFDGNGMLPMRAMKKEQYSARFFRDIAHPMLEEFRAISAEPAARKQFSGSLDLPGYAGDAPEAAAAACAIDHGVAPVAMRGGRGPAREQLARFVADGLTGYAEGNRSVRHMSGLSPYLHFGFIGIAEVFEAALTSGAPDEDVDAFLEQAVIRRELSFNLCFNNEAHDSLTALPEWARRTLDQHRGDRRKPAYSHDELEAAATHDEVWNLAQRQLLVCGTMHGYLRMLWGKKIIEWSETPEEAHRTMLLLHERYALDGRDPNTHAGVLWCFGKHDRPWAPERPVFGSIRWMSSEQTARKVRLAEVEALIATEERRESGVGIRA